MLFEKYCQTVLGINTVTYEELQTIFCEIEIILNNRPLTFTYDNPKDPEVTPDHLLFGRCLNLQVTQLAFTSSKLTIEALEHDVKYVQS